MKTVFRFMAFPLFVIISSQIHADSPHPSEKPEKEEPRPLCFNVFCAYQNTDGPGFKKCESASRFIKLVTSDGKEIPDQSVPPFHAEFEVTCNDDVYFNGIAHRYTDSLGTRIQAEIGPYPATLIPRGALQEGHRYWVSSLELPGQTLHGYCYVYTGPQ